MSFPRIQFLADTTTAQIDPEHLTGDTLIVYREGFDYEPPNIEGARALEWREYRGRYVDLKPDTLVLVGLNRIINPQNRTDLIFEHLQTLTSSMVKYSIDTSPWIGEPWRLWFHYSVARGEWLGINYSYAVETDWQKWFYRDRDSCPLSEAVEAGDIPPTLGDIEHASIDWKFHQPDLVEQSFYEEVKSFAFEKASTPKTIINEMLRELAAQFERPTFDDYRTSQARSLPDFPIYRFVHEENLRRARIWNAVSRGVNHESVKADARVA